MLTIVNKRSEKKSYNEQAILFLPKINFKAKKRDLQKKEHSARQRWTGTVGADAERDGRGGGKGREGSQSEGTQLMHPEEIPRKAPRGGGAARVEITAADKKGGQKAGCRRGE